MALRFVATSSDRRPATDLLEALLDEYNAAPGRALSGGPSAEPSDFTPPTGIFLVVYEHDQPVACGGVKSVQAGVGAVKRMYVVPKARRRGVGRALLVALEDAAGSMGFRSVRLDCERHNWPFLFPVHVSRQPGRSCEVTHRSSRGFRADREISGLTRMRDGSCARSLGTCERGQQEPRCC